MTPASVTVFGASGFLGRYVVRAVAETGATIRAAERRPLRAEFLKPSGEAGQIVPIRADVLNEREVAAAVAGVEAVVNLVGILAERGRQTFPAVHTEAAGRIARAAAAAGVRRLVHVSAIGADAHSASSYARSKAAGEREVRAAFPAATVVRPSIVFGPEDDFFNRFAGLARYLPALPLIGGGRTRFQPVYVADVADAIRAILTRDETAGRTFELGGPRIYTFRELMALMLAEIGRRRLLVPLPVAVAMLEAAFLEKLPSPIVTRDQIRQLAVDNVVGPGAAGLDALGVRPTSLEVILPTYLERYRKPVGRQRGHTSR